MWWCGSAVSLRSSIRQKETASSLPAVQVWERHFSPTVMRAFGLTGRNPGETEREMIERWFGEYGFTKEVVLEACNRTMEATHNPSFRYADKILSDWRKAGVHSLNDISVLDEQYKGQKSQKTRKNSRQTNNQFLNFEQRNTDYDSMVLNQVKDWIGEQ